MSWICTFCGREALDSAEICELCAQDIDPLEEEPTPKQGDNTHKVGESE